MTQDRPHHIWIRYTFRPQCLLGSISSERQWEQEVKKKKKKKMPCGKIIVWIWTRAQVSCLEELKVNINVKSDEFYDSSSNLMCLISSCRCSVPILLLGSLQFRLIIFSTPLLKQSIAAELMRDWRWERDTKRLIEMDRGREGYLISSPFDRHFK